MQCSCWDTVMEERLLQTLDVSQFKDHNSLNYFDNFVSCQLYWIENEYKRTKKVVNRLT